MFTVRLNEINWDQEAPAIPAASTTDEDILKALEEALGHEVNNGRKDGPLFHRPDFLAPEFESQVTKTHRQVMIINDMGFGKTMFSKYLFESQFSEDRELISEKLRVYINLKDMMKKVKDEKELICILAKYLLDKYKIKKPERRAGMYSIEEVSAGIASQINELHFLFDGLDECTEGDQYRFVNALAKYKQHIAFILTSRDVPIIQKIKHLDTASLITKTCLAETPAEEIDKLVMNFVETRSSKGKMKEKFKALLATPLFYKEFETLGAHAFKGSADSFVLKPSLADFYLILLRASLKAKKTSFKTFKEFIDKLFDTSPDSNEHINNIRDAAEFCYQDMCSKGKTSILDNHKDYIKTLIEIGWCYKSEGQVEWRHLSYKEFLAALHIAKIMQDKANLKSSLFIDELKHARKIYEFTTGILVSHAMQHPESNFIKTDLAAQLNYLLAESGDDEIKKIEVILDDLAEDDAVTKEKHGVYKQMLESLYFDVPSVKRLRKILTPFYRNNLALLIDLMVNPYPARNKELTAKKIGKMLDKRGEYEPELTKYIKDIWSLDEIKEKFDLKIEEPVAGSGRIDLYLSPKVGSGIDTLILLEFKKGTEDKEIGSLLNKAINQALVGRNSAESIAQTMETSADPGTVFQEVCLGNPAYQSGYINGIDIQSHVKNIIVVGGVYIVTPKKGIVPTDCAPKQVVKDVRFKVFETIISADDLKFSREMFKKTYSKMLLLKREIYNHAYSGLSSGIHMRFATSMLDHLLTEIKNYKRKLATVSPGEKIINDVTEAPAAKRPRVQLASADDDTAAMLPTAANNVIKDIPSISREYSGSASSRVSQFFSSPASSSATRMPRVDIESPDLNIHGHDGWLTALTVLPDGRLASGATDKTIRLWNVETGVCEVILQGHTDSVNSIVALPGGMLASGSSDNQIRIWDTVHAKCTGILSGHEGKVKTVIVLPDGRLASGSRDNTIRIWNLHTMKCELTLQGQKLSLEAPLAELPGGRLVSSLANGNISIWNVVTGKCESILEGYKYPALSFAVLPDGRLVSGSPEIRIWNMQTRKYVVLYRDEYNVMSFTVLPDGRLAAVSWDKKIRIWNMHTMKCELILEGHQKPALALTMLPDGRLASASGDKTIRLWNVKTGLCELVMPKDEPEITEEIARALFTSQENAFVFMPYDPLILPGNIVEVPGDGNCFFHAVAHELKRRDFEVYTHEELRAKAVQYLIDDPELLDNHPPEGETPEQYLNRMSKSGEWAEGPIIEALAKVLNLHFMIFETATKEEDFGHPMHLNDEKDLPVIGLIKKPDHYDALELMNEKGIIDGSVIAEVTSGSKTVARANSSSGAAEMLIVNEGEEKAASHSANPIEARLLAGHKRSRSEMSNSMTHPT